ncbi:unnamed protein product, partial [Diplocarpon coronariae]
MMASG